ncbi:protein phosphatase 2C 8 [Populus alba x Populus x berolinensis]|nr:protein phosphatase 2C 8 [Populus alba x Populus x berolinensis]
MSERSTNPVTETETSNRKRESPIIIEESNSESKKQKTEAEELSSEESKRNDSGTEEKKQKQQQIAAEKEFKIEANAAEDKGSRHSMEDAWVVLLDASLDSPGKLRCAHFAIYDGHGGRLAAEYAQKNLHKNVVSSGLPRELLDVKAAKKAILDGMNSLFMSSTAYFLCNIVMQNLLDVKFEVFGKLMSLSFKKVLQVFIANIGDAKAVLARSSIIDGSQNHPDGASPLKAIVLTREHKAIYPQERARIQKAGGSVSSNGRLQGRLEVSRAFGDRHFKKVGVVATPDIHSFDLTDREHFIILGCDGLWGVFGPSDAVEFVQKLLKEGLTVAAVSRRLVREAVLERRCKDNCTAIIIVFKHS